MHFAYAIQGDLYSRGKGYVDIKFIVPVQYTALGLKRNFEIAVNKNCSTTIRVTLYSDKLGLIIYRVSNQVGNKVGLTQIL